MHVYAAVFALSTPPPPSHCYQLCIGQDQYSTLFYNFIKEEKKKKHDIFTICDKSSYTGSFFVIFPCVHIITPSASALLFFFILP
jgi:hypothetical protein